VGSLEQTSPAFFQFVLLVEAIAVGFGLGFLWDFYRVLRLNIKLSLKITFFTDLLFWLLLTLLVLFLLIIYWRGEIHIYTYVGLASGYFLYLVLLSSFIQSFWQKIFRFLKIFNQKILAFLKLPYSIVSHCLDFLGRFLKIRKNIEK